MKEPAISLVADSRAAPGETRLRLSPLAPDLTLGRLRLRFERLSNSGLTVLKECEQQPPLGVVRAFTLRDGESLVHLHNLSGGVLGGDRLALVVEIGQGAQALLTSTGATRLYRNRRDAPAALQTNHVTVGAGAVLEYVPDMVIPFAGARYRQQSVINLAAGAGLFWWEMVAAGRDARNELFAYDLLEFKFDLRGEGELLAQERIRLEPKGRAPLLFGPYRYFSSLYICRVGLEASSWLTLESEISELACRLSCAGQVWWGVSTLTAQGLVVRGLSMKGRSLENGLMAFWSVAKLALYGRMATAPRKVN